MSSSLGLCHRDIQVEENEKEQVGESTRFSVRYWDFFSPLKTYLFLY